MIINVVDVQILEWTVIVETQCVRIRYRTVTDTGETYQLRDAWFWVTLPDEPTPDDFLLPAEYVATLTDLTNDAREALLVTIG